MQCRATNCGTPPRSRIPGLDVSYTRHGPLTAFTFNSTIPLLCKHFCSLSDEVTQTSDSSTLAVEVLAMSCLSRMLSRLSIAHYCSRARLRTRISLESLETQRLRKKLYQAILQNGIMPYRLGKCLSIDTRWLGSLGLGRIRPFGWQRT
jgi:hypothetical protein